MSSLPHQLELFQTRENAVWILDPSSWFAKKIGVRGEVLVALKYSPSVGQKKRLYI